MKHKLLFTLACLLLLSGCTAMPEDTSSAPNETETMTPTTSPSVSTESEFEIYESVLRCETGFYSSYSEDGEKVFLNTYLYAFLNEYDISFYGNNPDIANFIESFTVIDLDADGTSEIILWLTFGNVRLVLHTEAGKTFGSIFGYREMNEIKMDGTFHWSGGAYHNGFGRLRFLPDSYEEIDIAYLDGDSYEDDTCDYYIDGKIVTQDDYWAFESKQDEKEEVEWVEFTQDNIEMKLYN